MVQPLVAQVAVRDDRLRAVVVAEPFPALGDLVQRLVPGDAFELLAAFGASAPQRIQDPVGVVVPLLVVLELHAQAAMGHGVFLVAAHAHQLAVLDLEDHRAGIRTIVRAAAVECLLDRG